MKKNIFLGIILFLSVQAAYAGGGWPQPRGGGFFKLSEWWVISNQHFTDVGKLDPNVTTGIFNTSLYAEYGFTDRLTGVLYFPFFSRAYFNNTVSGTTGEVITPGEAINTVGDTDVSLKYGILANGPVALSATLTLGLPLGNDSGGSAGNLQTGDGEFNQLLQVDAGRGFRIGKVGAYANAYVGFNNRTNDFSDELRFGIEGGATFWDGRLTAILRLYGVQSLNNGALPSELSNSTSIFANNTEHLSYAPELAYNISDKWGVSVSTGRAFSGRLIFANPSYSVGVFVKL
ncbi:MAG: hypothetical protein KDD10_19535 [Phaeodactylibacter sp.]|nr:hypothetical protein [Phaeodactylibacter sp.]MCB9297446.1 hypothetical protein [Lewinellaceae bacterium]